MNKNYLFLGFAIPDEEIKKIFAYDKTPHVHTHKFIWNLIKGLILSGESDFTFISSRPVSDYPYYTKKIIKKREWEVEISSKRIAILEIPFINTSILKIITRFFSGLFYCFFRFFKKKPKNGIIVFSVHVPFMLIGYILSKIFKVDFIGIWTDPPSVVSFKDSFLKRRLRSIEFRVSKWLMRHFSKVIVLTRYLAEDYAPGKPYLVIEGIIDENEVIKNADLNKKYSSNVDHTKILYSGSLKKKYGIKNIVDGVLLTGNNRIILEVFGSGDYESEINRLSKIHKNIKFMGWVPNDVVLKAQRDADFLINARSPDDDFVKYTFPSKTLEYMLSGTPLITTMLPGIPNEYAKNVIAMKDNKPETICKTLQEVLLLDNKRRKEISLQALVFAKSKNYLIQGTKIYRFINNLWSKPI